jgi:hypothetical protein
VKLGVIADGQAEVAALKELLSRIDVPGRLILSPLYADMQPLAGPDQIARAAESRLNIYRQRGCENTVILLDHENRGECPGAWALRIVDAFAKLGFHGVSVVIKQRAFENWLIGDLESLRRKHPKRYSIRDGLVDRVHVSGADNINAEALLNGCVPDGYCKRRDAIEICKTISPLAVASVSRSFRRFLRVIGHTKYSGQSRLPYAKLTDKGRRTDRGRPIGDGGH